MVLKKVPEPLCRDASVVFTALAQRGTALRVAPLCFRANVHAVLVAVAQDHNPRAFAAEEVRDFDFTRLARSLMQTSAALFVFLLGALPRMGDLDTRPPLLKLNAHGKHFGSNFRLAIAQYSGIIEGFFLEVKDDTLKDDMPSDRNSSLT